MNPELTSEPIPSGLSFRACRLLTGLDVGLGCAVAVLVWQLFHSWLRGEFWWAKLNVAGAVFYGGAVYSMGFSKATLAGFALLFVLYSMIGVVFSLFARTRGFTQNFILAFFCVLTWHIFAQRFLWRSFDPFGPSYFPILATLPGHLLAGFCLTRFAIRFRSMAFTFGDPLWASDFLPPAHVEEEQAATVAVPTDEPASASGDSETAVNVESSGNLDVPPHSHTNVEAGQDPATPKGDRTEDC